jgi:integrase
MTGVAGDMDVKLKWVYRDRDRHGNVRIYFWRGANRKVRIHETPGTPEFSARYHALVDQAQAGLLRRGAARHPLAPLKDTLGWLVQQYLADCPHYRGLAPIGQRAQAGVLRSILAEPVHPGAAETFRDFPLDRLSPKAIRTLRDRKAGLPGAANKRLKTLRAVFKWATDDEDGTPRAPFNPCLTVRNVDQPTAGFHTWTVAEVEQFKAHHPIGSKARLAMELLLYTGFRRSDMVEFGRQHIHDGWVRKPQVKGHRQRLVLLEFPVLPDLAHAIAEGPAGNLTFLMTEHGRPFTPNGFGNWFRDRCDEAGLPHCASHGLRKAGATIAAENGATPHQLQSIFGWTTLKQPERYTRTAARRRLAGDAMHLISLPREFPTATLPTSTVGKNEPEKAAKSRGKKRDGGRYRTT